MTGQVGTKRLAARCRRWAGVPLAAVVLAGGLSACGGPGSSAATVVRTPAGASVRTAQGSTFPARAGEVLPAGATVLATGGGTMLSTGGRVVVLGPRAQLDVLSPRSVALLSGDLVVNRSAGPSVTVSAGSVTVGQIGRGAVRIDRRVSVRVAAYSTAATVSTAAGSATVTALHQVLVPGRALPGEQAPLALSDDALDRAGDPGLVATDEQFDLLAAGVDAQAGQPSADRRLARVVPAGFVTLPAGGAASERLLPFAIAIASRSGLAVDAADAQAVGLREAGGSWAVVAGLLSAQLSPVAAVLAHIEDAAAAAAQLGPGVVAAAATTTRVPTVPAGSGRATAAAGAAGAVPTGSRRATTGTSPQRHRAGRRPKSVAAPAPSPLGSVVTVLLSTLGALLDASPVAAPTATAPTAAPTPGSATRAALAAPVSPPAAAHPAATPAQAARSAATASPAATSSPRAAGQTTGTGESSSTESIVSRLQRVLSRLL